MLSPDAKPVTLEDGSAKHEQALVDFAKKIEACIDGSDWDALSIILESRQTYLEQLFQRPSSLDARNALKQLALSLLEQDEVFQSRIEIQKKISSQQQLSLERSRRAISAYSDQ